MWAQSLCLVCLEAPKMWNLFDRYPRSVRAERKCHQGFEPLEAPKFSWDPAGKLAWLAEPSFIDSKAKVAIVSSVTDTSCAAAAVDQAEKFIAAAGGLFACTWEVLSIGSSFAFASGRRTIQQLGITDSTAALRFDSMPIASNHLLGCSVRDNRVRSDINHHYCNDPCSWSTCTARSWNCCLLRISRSFLLLGATDCKACFDCCCLLVGIPLDWDYFVRFVELRAWAGEDQGKAGGNH